MPRRIDPTGGPHGQGPSDAWRLADFLSSRELASCYVQNNLSSIASMPASSPSSSPPTKPSRATGAGGREPSPKVPLPFVALLFDLFLMYFKFVPESGGAAPPSPSGGMVGPCQPQCKYVPDIMRRGVHRGF